MSLGLSKYFYGFDDNYIPIHGIETRSMVDLQWNMFNLSMDK